MTARLFGIGAAVAAAALTTAFAATQETNAQAQPGAPPVVQRQAPAPPGQVGPGRAPGPQVGPRAGRGGPTMGRGRGAGRGTQGETVGQGRGLAFLDLTDDQRTKITDLQRGARDQAAPLEDELVFTRRTLHRELFADKRDNAKVNSLSAKIATLEKQLADLRVKTMTAVADLLTPDQRETMRLRERGRGGLGRGPGRPPGFAAQ